jgi:hypothetical protein
VVFFYHNGVLPGRWKSLAVVDTVRVGRLNYDSAGLMRRVYMTTDGLQGWSSYSSASALVWPSMLVSSRTIGVG